jgi:hypothetical protein
MKAASLSDLKKELKLMKAEQLSELLLRITRFKKENKELLTYLVFESENEAGYIDSVKEQITDVLDEANTSQGYLAKKTIRKALRIAAKFAKYSEHKTTEIELLIHFCSELRKLPNRILRQPVIHNLYNRQVDKIVKLYNTLHEDVQFDYKDALESLGAQNHHEL